MIDHSSERRFSTGVPVRATRNPALKRWALLLCFASGFFMFCASSSTTAFHLTWLRVVSSRGRNIQKSRQRVFHGYIRGRNGDVLDEVLLHVMCAPHSYTAEDVVRLRGSVHVEHTLAKRGADKLWHYLHTEPFVNALGAMTGNQAMQQVKAGLKAIYLSGWQVAGDANLAGEMYPDQSLYPINSVPQVVKRINNTLTRADQIQWSEGRNPKDADYIDYFAPIVADAEAGFGGVLNAFELMKAMIEAGAAGVHFEDQLASVKKCGHMGGKVLVPTREAVAKLVPISEVSPELVARRRQIFQELQAIGREIERRGGPLTVEEILAWRDEGRR